MSISAAANQKAIDDSAELDILAEQIEQEMREELLDGGYYALEFRKGFGVAKAVYDRDNVVTAMMDLDGEAFNEAVMMVAKDPIAAAELMAALMKRAVEQVLGMAEIREDAEYRIELNRRNAA